MTNAIFPRGAFVGTQRNDLRKLVRSHPKFDAWRAINDPKNTMLRPSIVQAVFDLGLETEACAILDKAQVTTLDSEAFEEHVETVKEKSDLSDPHVKAVFDAVEDEGDTSAASPIDVDMEAVLGHAKPFLASGLIASMEAALRPIVVKAHKPAEKQIITIHPAPVLREGEAAHGVVTGQSTMAKLFKVGGARGKRSVQLWNDPEAPAIDAGYVMDGDRMYLGASAFEAGETVWFFGPAGAGKTTLAQEYAALTGRGFVRIGFNHSTEMIDLLGQKEIRGAKDGGSETYWQDGVFTRAIRRAGTVILLDELTGSPPGTSMAFQTILDHRKVTLPTGEVVHFAHGVVVAIADNTAGYGDESGVYAGTQSANGALVDRAARMVPVPYLPALLEAEALSRRTGAPMACCIRLADFASTVRTVQAQNKSDSRPFSIRRLVAFANATYRDLLPAEQAWEVCAYSRLPEMDREELRQAVRAHFDTKAYERELKGEAAPVDPVQTEIVMGPPSPEEEARQARAKRAFNQA